MNTSKIFLPEQLEEMLNNSSIDAIIAFDEDNKIVSWNNTAEKVYGKSKHSVIGKNVFEIIPSFQEDEETLNAVCLAQKGIKNFLPASKKYNHRLHVENHFIPLKDKGEIIGVMNLIHDVAHRIKSEEKLEQLNSELEKRLRQLKMTSDELSSFTFITSNKIKEPIRHIYTSIEYLIKTEASNLSNTGKANFRRIQASLNRMDLLLNDILKLSRIDVVDEQPVLMNVEKIADDVLKILNKKIAEKNAVIVKGKMANIEGNENHLFIVLEQLIDNAIKFNESKTPTVVIECEIITLNEKANDEKTSNQYCRLSVSDNGIGFDKNDEERMFKMFEKLNDQTYKGSGIGLALVRKIMEAQNGFIQVETSKEGSIFKCFFSL